MIVARYVGDRLPYLRGEEVVVAAVVRDGRVVEAEEPELLPGDEVLVMIMDDQPAGTLRIAIEVVAPDELEL